MTCDILAENIRNLESGKSLLEIEKQVFDVFEQACNLFNPKVVARVAGGWVRDKILGKESDDIDFALENASGEEFAQKLKEEYNAKIQLNPAQSSQLESAKAFLFNKIWIDICQLRCDEYSEDSRIPTIRVGSPLEDSVRRDITINCLYFNINTKKVEDFCNGIQDLKNRMINTPIDPMISFKDDPLRILRCFRFGSRFGFTVNPNIISAAAANLTELKSKVTHPRIEMELHKALTGSPSFEYLRLCIESGIFNFVFDEFDEWSLDANAVLDRARISSSRFTKEHAYSLSLACIYFQLYDLPLVSDPLKPSKKIPALECAIVRRLHCKNDIYVSSNKVIAGVKNLHEKLINNLNRVSVGLWLMDIGDFWPLSRALCFTEDDLHFFDEKLIPFIEAEKLDGIWKMKPLINGKDLAKVHNVKAGPILARLTKELIEWQLANPNGTADDYKNYVLTTKK